MLVGLVLLVCAACQEGRTNEVVLVSAASSLTDVFTEIEARFEAGHPDVDVVLNLAGSSTLRDQILEGAPADVFASADISNMSELESRGVVSGEPTIFTHNRLQIAVPAGNPAGIGGLGDFDDPDLLIGLCAEYVPCGMFARQALARAGVTPSIDTNELDVRALLVKIETGELDAGITYVTDVTSTKGAVEGIDIPEALNVVADYPIAVLSTAPHAEAAAEFVDFVLSAEGQAILTGYGFDPA